MFSRLLGRIGRRYWVRRVSLALGRAREQGLIDSWMEHELDARIKGYAGIAADARYPSRNAR